MHTKWESIMDLIKYFQREGISDFEIVFTIMNVKLIGHLVPADDRQDDGGWARGEG
jgi:hypothetical protein